MLLCREGLSLKPIFRLFFGGCGCVNLRFFCNGVKPVELLLIYAGKKCPKLPW